MTQQILSWFTPTGLRPVPYYTVRISTKNKWSADQVLQTLQPAATHCFSAVIPAEPTAVTGAYTESTVKPRTTLADPLSKSHHTQNPLCARTPLHPAENTLLKPTAVTGAYTESTVKPRTTLADPLSKLHLVQNPPHRSELPVQAIQTEPSTIQFQNSNGYNH